MDKQTLYSILKIKKQKRIEQINRILRDRMLGYTANTATKS